MQRLVPASVSQPVTHSSPGPTEVAAVVLPRFFQSLKDSKSRQGHRAGWHCPSAVTVLPSLACSQVKWTPGDGAKDSPRGSAPRRCQGTPGTEPPPQHPPPRPIPSGCTPGWHLSPGWSSSLLQVVGSRQVILRDDADRVVELSDPPAVDVVLLGRASGGTRA